MTEKEEVFTEKDFKKNVKNIKLQENSRKVFVIGCGHSLPGPPISNKHIMRVCNLEEKHNDKWAREKIGIKTRHCAQWYPEDYLKKIEEDDNFNPEIEEFQNKGIDPRYTNSKLSAEAAREALKHAQLKVSDIDLIIHSSCTPDYPVPSTATFVQEELGLKEVMAFDIRSACCGSTQAFETANAYLLSGIFKNVLIIGVDVGTVFGELDKNAKCYSKADAVNAYLIGDGGGACVLTSRSFNNLKDENNFIEKYPNGVLEILYAVNKSIGYDKKPGMYLPGGGSKHPCCQRTINEGLHRFQHDFRGIISHGPTLYYRALRDVLGRANISLADIALLLPHQANGSVKMLGEKMGIPSSKLYCNFESVGNTANGSQYLMLHDIINDKKASVKNGDLLMLVSAESTKWLYGGVLLRFFKGKQLKSTKSKSIRNSTFRQRFYVGFRMFLSGTFLRIRSILYSIPIIGKRLKL
mmetsp:Transcript_5442/g.8032  ORF Transcript_5442/g.8032 Transcript_5442/m.8032 type:complete len:467 (-) Transcript_5442:441-1841(-)